MDRISVNPQIHFGKPCIAGTRIPVQSILELLTEGLSFEEIAQDYYPDLEIVDNPAQWLSQVIQKEQNNHALHSHNLL